MKRVVGIAIAINTLLWAAAAQAQDVRLVGPEGSPEIEGRLTGFDGEFYEVDTVYGPLTLDAARVTCTGPGCPDIDAYVPTLVLSGAPSMGGILVPALVEAFGARYGLTSERKIESDRRFTYDLTDAEDDRVAARFIFQLSSSDEAFADLLAGVADVALSAREIRPDELDRAIEAGLGDLSASQRARVLALDAIVPIAGTASPLRTVSFEDLAAVFSGAPLDWTGREEDRAPARLHLLPPATGTTQAFMARIMEPAEAQLSEEVVFHDDAEALADAVAADPLAVGIAPYSELGNAQVLGLSGSCGYATWPSDEGLRTEDFPLTAPLFIYTPARRFPAVVRDFLAFAQSPAAAIVVRRAGFVDQRPSTIPMGEQGLRLANAIRGAGQGVGLRDLRSMVGALDGFERLTVTFRFKTGSSDLDAQSQSNISLLAEILEAGLYDGRTLLFAGFSDGVGDAAQNRRLSERRAEAVRDAVVQAAEAADLDRLIFETAGFGEAMPMACDDVEWGQQVNRRVEVWLR